MHRIEEEKRVISRMIGIYCRHKEGNKRLCTSCAELEAYALLRLSKCPFGEAKTTCRLCRVHCYSPQMSKRIREVMRYAGPRMLFYAPSDAIRHIIREWRRNR